LPIYGYRCQACAHEFEVTQRMSDPAQAACPVCGAPATRRFFPAGILFKGSGFYKTDSRSTAASSSASSTSSSTDGDKKAANGSGGSGDKPASKESPPAKPAPASNPTSSGSAKAASTSD
jgi:putative FmdB family regulatory protein